MMTRNFAALLTIGAFVAGSAAAAEPTPTPSASSTSPLVGEWTLDVATLPMPPEARPQRVALAFRDAPDGKWSTQVEIVDAKGARLHAASTVALDGTPGRATGTYWVDLVAAKMPSPDVLVMQFVYEGIPRSTRVYSVSADGAVLTETESYFRDGKPVLRTAHFTRAKGKP